MDYISHYSLYAYENELRQGFVTVEGGHRVGVAGKVIMEKERVKNIQYISSLNIRVSHEVLGCADRLIPYIVANKQVCHTLIISPPCCGKTTLIRDLIRQISDGNEYVKGCSVGVVDERSERDCTESPGNKNGCVGLLPEGRRDDYADPFHVTTGDRSG